MGGFFSLKNTRMFKEETPVAEIRAGY